LAADPTDSLVERMNYITRYVTYAVESTMRGMTDEEQLEVLEWIVEYDVEEYLKREFALELEDIHIGLGREFYLHGYSNVEWRGLYDKYEEEFKRLKDRVEQEKLLEEDEDTTDTE
jgi:hypothetical protein